MGHIGEAGNGKKFSAAKIFGFCQYFINLQVKYNGKRKDRLCSRSKLLRSDLFVQRSLAARANVNTLNLPVNIQFHFMNIGIERSDGVSVRVADIFTRGSALAAYLTYFAHLPLPPFSIYRNTISLT